MVAYEFYFHDHAGKENLIGILPERRKNSERITPESIMKWGKIVAGEITEVKDISLFRVEI